MADIKPFRAEDIQEKIRAEIQGRSLELIPQEQWDALIKREVDTFFNPPHTRNWEQPLPSSFSRITQDALNEVFTKKITEIVTSDSFKDVVDKALGLDKGPEAVMEKVLTLMAPKLLQELRGAFSAALLQNTFATVQNNFSSLVDRGRSF